jgi:N-acetylglutamate synthase-like GNAT family acetyltransferase
VELQVREAKLTDIDRISSLIERAQPGTTAAGLASAVDHLRRLIYLPHAAVAVALAERQFVGTAVLALRPSVAAGGLIGTVDLLLVEPGQEENGAADALLAEMVRSARNKGCVAIDGPVPNDPVELARWERLGFSDTEVRMNQSLRDERTAAAAHDRSAL